MQTSWKLSKEVIKQLQTPEGYFEWLNDNLSLGSSANVSRIITLVISSTTIVSVGEKLQAKVISPFTGTIASWRLSSDVACTATVDVWKNTTTPTNTDSITGSAKPSLTASDVNSSSTLTGWNTAVTEGDILMLEVESNDMATYLSLQLKIV